MSQQINFMLHVIPDRVDKPALVHYPVKARAIYRAVERAATGQVIVGEDALSALISSLGVGLSARSSFSDDAAAEYCASKGYGCRYAMNFLTYEGVSLGSGYRVVRLRPIGRRK